MEYSAEKIINELYPEKPGRIAKPGTEIIAAVYLRQSTVCRQNYESIEEQLEFIKHRLVSEQVRSILYPNCKIIIPEELIFFDKGKTGRVGREGYEAYKNEIRFGESKIDLVYDLSRLTREMGGLLDSYDVAHAYMKEIVSVSEGISSHAEGARMHFMAKGMANEMQSESISRATQRGLELRALRGISTGHLPYAFDSVYEDPNRPRDKNETANKIIVIHRERGIIVVRIFTLYADTDLGCDAIAKLLNDEGIPSPTGKKWIGSTVNGILHQLKYIGIWIHGRTCIKRDPIRDRLVPVEKPRNEWIVRTHEHLRIVPQDLWDRVHVKLKVVEKQRREARNKPDSIWGKNRGQSNHLFTGTMICEKCGSTFMTVSGKGGGYLGCRNAYKVGSCDNKQSVQLSWVEGALLNQLKAWIDEPKTIDFICKEYNEKMNERLSTIPQRIKDIQKELAGLERNISNYVGFISEGNASEAVASALRKAESRKELLEAQLANLKAREPQKLFITPFAIRESLCNLEEILKLDVPKANAYLRRLFPKPIKMTPKQKDRSYFYEAVGEVNLTKLMRYSVPVNGAPNGI